MKRPGLIWIAALSLTCSSDPARAWDWLTLAPTRIAAFTGFDGYYKRYIGDGDSLDYQWDIGLEIEQQGYILDPRISGFQFTLKPTYFNGLFKNDFSSQKNKGNFLSYQFQMDFLNGAEKPYSFNASALRAQSINTGSFGTRYDSEVESKTASAFWHNPAFPMRMTYEDRYFNQTYLSNRNDSDATPTTQRDERAKVLTLTGHSSKLSMLAEHLSVDDNVPGRNLDYKKDRVDLNHVLPWGTASSLNSLFTYDDRRGFNAYRRINLNERANIQHTDNISSISRYNFASVKRIYQNNVNVGSFALTHLLYRNLLTTANIWASSQQSDPANITQWRGGITTRYTKNFFGAGVTAGLGYSYQVTDRNSKLPLTEVVNESHVVPLDGAVILSQRFIVASSIIVTNEDGSLLYEDGADYTILGLPDDLTQVQTIPGGRIETGNTILVSYQASTLPSLEYSTVNTNYQLGLNLGWMRFSHTYTDQDEKLISGQGSSFLNPRRVIRTRLDFNWTWSDVDIGIGAARNYNRYNNYEGNNYTFRQTLDWNAFRNTYWNLAAVQSFTHSTTLDTKIYSLEMTVNWQPRASLSIRPTLSMWRREDEGEAISTNRRDQQYVTVGFWLSWRYRKVTFNMNYFHNNRVTDGYQSNTSASRIKEDRLFFDLTRRF